MINPEMGGMPPPPQPLPSEEKDEIANLVWGEILQGDLHKEFEGGDRVKINPILNPALAETHEEQNTILVFSHYVTVDMNHAIRMRGYPIGVSDDCACYKHSLIEGSTVLQFFPSNFLLPA